MLNMHCANNVLKMSAVCSVSLIAVSVSKRSIIWKCQWNGNESVKCENVHNTESQSSQAKQSKAGWVTLRRCTSLKRKWMRRSARQCECEGWVGRGWGLNEQTHSFIRLQKRSSICNKSYNQNQYNTVNPRQSGSMAAVC